MSSLPRLPLILWNLTQVLVRVEDPFTFIRCYVGRRVLPRRVVRFRNGLTVYLADSQDDLPTVFSVLQRRSYGKLKRGGIVVDVGANIGTFAIEAAREGARRVYAFEPNSESMSLLRLNAAVNGFSNVILASRYAVTSQNGAKVCFPPKSDPNNAICAGNFAGACERVETITLAEIVSRFHLRRIDLLKIDCEGAEYEIVEKSPDWVWRRVRDIRMEYHLGEPARLCRRLEGLGFRTTRHWRTTESSGQLWLTNEAAPARRDPGAGERPVVKRAPAHRESAVAAAGRS